MTVKQVVAILQARMGASRLPGKVLLPVAGTTFLEYELRQIATSRRIAEVILATTDQPGDDPVAELGERLGMKVFRGSEKDVLDRYHGAAALSELAHIMRITGDCPLLQPDVCDHAVETYFDTGADYCRTSELFAEGLDCEVFSRRALDEAWQEATLPSEREHVTLFMRNRPERYHLRELTNATHDGHYRLTLDEEADRKVLTAVIDALHHRHKPFIPVDAVKNWLDKHPEVMALNSSIVRNEGLIKSLAAEGCLVKVVLPEEFSGAPLREIAEQTSFLRRDLISDGYDEALARLGKHAPMTVHEYPTGTECFTWIVPEKWTCREARLERLSGEVVFSDKDHPLHAMSYSLPFSGEVSREELMAHLHSAARQPEAVAFAHKYYVRNWGLCCSEKQKAALTDESYRVHIDTVFEQGTLKVGEVVLPGESNRSFVLCAHLCHPCQFNDGLSGIVAGIEALRRMAGRKNKYTYRLVILPETIGSAAWLSHNAYLHDKIFGGVFLEMLALTRPHTLQLSATGTTRMDRLIREAVTGFDPEAEVVRFPNGVLNDERMFNSTGIAIPMVSLSRCVPRSTSLDHFETYHTSFDTPENADFDALKQSVALLVKIMEAVEEERVPVPRFQGEIFCSRFKSIDYMAMLDLVMRVPYFLDGKRGVREIAEAANLPESDVRSFLDVLTQEGLVAWE
jgi:aminopeptidase-like protein/spore coat polysaccharide biosynthesis protein SpsF (cytidylyltransferase family)